MPRDKNQKQSKSKAQSEQTAVLVATSQQSRFHTDATDPADVSSKDLDIRGLHLTIGLREILSDAELKLQYGVHYAVVGRNGVGKSTLLTAIGEKHIPNIPSNLRVLLLGQTPASDNSGDGYGETVQNSTDTVLQHVIKSDSHREQTIREVALLSAALENTSDHVAAPKVVRRLKHERRIRELEVLRKIAAYRSGARGLKARKELRELEEALEVSKASLEQECSNFEEGTVAQETQEAIQMLNELEASLDAMNASSADSRARSLLLGLGFSSSTIDSPLSSLSGGWKTRCNLARILFQPSDYLLLDEPTNFLDLAAMLWLQEYLQTLQSTVLIITHDREFVDAVADELLVVRDQKLEHFHGNLSSYDTARRDQQRRMTRMKDAQDRQKQHMEQTIQGNIRAAKSSGDDKKLKQAVSRQRKLDERMGIEVSAKGGRFKLNRDLAGYYLSRRDEIEIPMDDPAVKFSFPKDPPPLRFPGALVAFENFGFRYKNAKVPVLKEVSLTVHPGGRVGIVGLNGAGKSTLLAHILDGSEPVGTKTGTITKHPKAQVGYFSQSVVEDLHQLGQRDKGATALSVMMQAAEGMLSEQEARSLLGSMGLQGRTASDVPLSLLSGGQKVRLALAKIMWSPPHLLVLDEVTTHLDSDTIMALVRELNGYAGALLVVTHDRFFMRSVVEGENPYAADEDGEEENPWWNGERSGDVWLLRAGRLKPLKAGMGEYEKVALKAAKKIVGGL